MTVELHSAGRRGPLRPSELAEAAVLGDLALVMEVIAWFAPIGIAGLFQALAVVPFAVLAARHRLRAGLVSAVSASTVAGLVGGIGIMVPVASVWLPASPSAGAGGHSRPWVSLRSSWVSRWHC
jgi:energy-coupling factor transport system ATP-binding protein